jgi:hypothetical protein
MSTDYAYFKFTMIVHVYQLRSAVFCNVQTWTVLRNESVNREDIIRLRGALRIPVRYIPETVQVLLTSGYSVGKKSKEKRITGSPQSATWRPYRRQYANSSAFCSIFTSSSPPIRSSSDLNFEVHARIHSR